ncbi:MAG: leucine-rich repeat protein [Muribaculaceae bacterium]|nr:leucine-rich repeat protein [Muribaculaceae bacterium]
MWITDNGFIRSNTQDIEGEASSKISTTFTIDKVSVFSFEIRNRTLYDEYEAKVYLDGALYGTCTATNWQFSSVVLYPGTHTVEFENRQFSYSDYDESITEIRNVRLDQTWYVANLTKPGEFALRLIEALDGKNLQDAELVKINGTMNSDDWSAIKQLTGVMAIDFTGTDITEIPAQGMYGLSRLNTVMLPETLTKIGNEAFRGTNFYQITVPASVEYIGSTVWDDTPLRYITFAQGSKLTGIGRYVFRGTKLTEFVMSDAVTEIGEYLFSGCKSLRRLHLSDNLTEVPEYVAYGCDSLSEVNIPLKATSIGDYAFYRTALRSLDIPASVKTLGSNFAAYCYLLKEVTLPPDCSSLDGCFNGCTALEKVVIPCATPPSITSDPFYGVAKENLRVLVPDFALAAYKTNIYWYQFTSLQPGDEASVRDYWAIRGNLTLDGSHAMQGTPSVEIMTNSSLVMESDAAQGFDTFTYNTSESAPASFLSRSNTVTANKLESRFYVSSANKWFFFSPVTDVNMSDVTFPASDSWVIRSYDGARRASENSTSGNWITVPADGTLHRGEGYIIQATATGWLNMPAATTEHEKFFGANVVTLPLADNTCETAENAGWNFVANPYPSYYDIYYINMQAPITVWTGSTYRAYSLNDADRGDDTFVLRPMQPFFVQKSSTDLTASMPLTGRQTDATIDRTRAPRREATVDPDRLKLNLEILRADSEEADDYTRIVVNDAAKMDYETRCDASKFMSLDATVAQIYSIGGKEHPMAINERPYADGNVALGVYLPEKGKTYTISARRADCRAWLYDALTGIEHDLTLGDYVFVADKAGTDNSRFTVRLAPVTTAVEDLDATPVKVTGNAGCITVSAPADSHIAVYATDGRVVTSMDAENGAAEIPAAAGVYVVKVNDRTFKTIVK